MYYLLVASGQAGRCCLRRWRVTRTICSQGLESKLKTAQEKKPKEPTQKKAKQKKQSLEEFYLTKDNQHTHNSRATVLTTARPGRGAQSAWLEEQQANSTEFGEETTQCQCSASITSS